MSTWVTDRPYDGIWCCASLLHLNDQEVKQFAKNLHVNLKSGGAVYLSVKSGIQTGFDEKDRFMKYFTEQELDELLRGSGITVVDLWITEDKMNRDGFHWINLIGIKE